MSVGETTYQSELAGELVHVIDGQDTGTQGWGLAPRLGEPQSLVLQIKEPVAAEEINLTLCFLSGKPGSFPANWSISGTAEPRPSLTSLWEPMRIISSAATGPTLEVLAGGHLAAGPVSRIAGDAVFQLRLAHTGPPLTGLRLEVFPWQEGSETELRLGRAQDRDFLLTEIRAESVEVSTTNVALHRKVIASHETYRLLPAEKLTDGLPGTFSHPAKPDLGAAFSFTLDLGTVRTIDHFALRNRGDGVVPDRWSKGLLEFSESIDGPPRWTEKVRTDGSHLDVGGVDIISAQKGKGDCRGQYLRISSSNTVSYSPQLAEVEAYDDLVPQMTEARADGKPLDLRNVLSTPSGSKVLDLVFKYPRGGLPKNLPIRWRLRGFHTDWQVTDGLTIQIPLPDPGHYHFQAQIQHTDGIWNTESLLVPMEILPQFWQTRWFYWCLAGLAVLLVVRLYQHRVDHRERHVAAKRRARKALEDERARIARDMHDDLGARLSQLAMLHEMFLVEHPLAPAASAGMLQLSANARQAVETLDQVVWAVNPRNDTLANVADYLTHCTTSYLNPLGITCRIDAPPEWPDLTVRAQTRHQLILAFKEALQNLAKHAAARVATLQLELTELQFTVTLKDDGKGLPATLDGVEKDGLDNMQARLHSIGGTAEIIPNPSGGTIVRFTLSLT
jgi:signal transduction histidine kinase